MGARVEAGDGPVSDNLDAFNAELSKLAERLPAEHLVTVRTILREKPIPKRSLCANLRTNGSY